MGHSPGIYIDGKRRDASGDAFTSHDPATGDFVWEGRAASADDVAEAVAAARRAFDGWAGTPLEQRAEYLRRFAARLESDKAALASTISRETGKPLWESLTEVAAMIGKVPLSELAFKQRCGGEKMDLGGARGATRFRPHGIVAVFGPFNLPGHLPNGHIIPALLAGNTVVLKPSELAPGVARHIIEAWDSVGLPPGVINLVQGGRNTGVALLAQTDIDGVCFTGSTAGGLWIRKMLAERPRVITALEMGGNNPLIVHGVADAEAAAVATIQSAYITSGQRCSCARRLIVPAGDAGDRFVRQLIKAIGRVRIGAWSDSPEPFMGPVISSPAAGRLLEAQQKLRNGGGQSLVEMTRLPRGGAFLSPGLIDVTRVTGREDAEHFGPLLMLIRVPDFDAAIDEANRTSFGLSAGLFCDRRELYDQFADRVRAGVIHWNRQLTNASSRLPFGGLGQSGNHRPSGFLAADYCSYAQATIELDRLTPAKQPIPGLDP
ncbi:MAG: succinylglutamate-semialdehyde dehydrogenase [Planctomycetes bacterium]|nr:succinylglutamate-semialdehyde dehydrogenase [Planctomycetota bacterium]